MTKTEMEKRFKWGEKIEKIFFTWAVGFILLILTLLIIGDTVITLQELAARSFTLMIFGWMIGLLNRALKKRELRKYDTGTLAQIDTES